MEYNNRVISPTVTIMQALKKMDEVDGKLLIVTNNDQLIGLLSIGDIQRAIINNISLQAPISDIIRPNPKVGSTDMSMDAIKQLMLKFRMELCPIVDNDGIISQIIFWDDLFKDETTVEHRSINSPVIVMAGGKGTRLRPLTHVIPKPLVPMGDKTMLERIINSFSAYDCNDYHISVNYKSDLIKFYIDTLNLPQNISYFTEPKPLGTAGSLCYLKDEIKETFFVTNCDILIEQDYYEIYDYHKRAKNEITLVSAIKNYEIPYGTLETSEDGQLTNIVEKPNHHYFINAGMYILEPQLLQEIPENKFYHITHLIEKLMAENRRVGVFPISENSWMDVGQWDEYNKTSKKLGYQQVKF